MLSKNFEKELYKQTNMWMNVIEVKPRIWQIQKPVIERDVEWKQIIGSDADEDDSFDIKNSVFKGFKLDTPTLLDKMFEYDFKLTKIPSKLIKDKDTFAKVKDTLKKLYPRIKNTFLVLACDSSYPCITSTDYLFFTQRCEFILKGHVPQAALDSDRIATCFRNDVTRKIEHSKSDITRFDFLEIIVRLSMLLYAKELNQEKANSGEKKDKEKDKKKKSPRKSNKMNLAIAIERLFAEYIDPAGLDVANTMEFRESLLYTFKVNQYYERNEGVFKTILAGYTKAGKPCISPTECIYFVQNNLGLFYIHERVIMRLYGYSKMITVDLVKDPKGPVQMVYVEFLEFFARISHYALI